MQFAPLFPVLHQILSPLFPGCLWGGNSQRREIALTFDDGPHPQHTPPLLDVLQQFQVQASFFSLGCLVERSPAIIQDIYQQGHWLGLHGYDHTSFPFLSQTQLKTGLERTQQAIADICGIEPSQVRDVRPPNGVFTPQTLRWLQQWQYRPVMWSVVPEDWVRPGIQVVVKRVQQQTCNGSIIVLHDGYCGGEDVAAAIAQLLPWLLDQGYQFVTIDQLWQAQ
ncbi:MAG: polysaccharide deacetylase family protein [Aphanocapsa sp. GSE-SYN-MK-11-07L]|jgi:peptidoglycan/xylan/chitin deacetylase (PgdA/CDA1 family)|nr:polysaccharide deacetylase family protein [Aphanocapsa sp. GSE-SYN-MK-11-07L]